MSSRHNNPLAIVPFIFLLLSFLVTSLPTTVAEPINSTNSSTQTTETNTVIWATNIEWDLANTPTENVSSAQIDGKARTLQTPVVVNGVIYVGATSTIYLKQYGHTSINWITVYAFDAQDGHQIWTYQAPFDSISNIAVSDGKVFFTGHSYTAYGSIASLYSLDAANGHLLWQTPCRATDDAPVTEKGRVFIVNGHSALAFDSTNGKILWNYTTNDMVITAPAITNGVLYVMSEDNNIYALNTADGNKLWSVYAEGGFSTPIIFDGVVYAPSDDGNIYALSVTTGSEFWRYRITPPEFSWANDTWCTTPMYINGVLYFTCLSMQHIHVSDNGLTLVCEMAYRSSLFAIDAGTGNKIWNYTHDSSQFNSAVSIAGDVIFTENGRSIIAFSCQNGALIWNYTSNIYPQTQTILAYGVLYMGFSDGQLYALNLSELGIQPENITVFGVLIDESVIIFVVIVVATIMIAFAFWYRNKHPKADRLTDQL